MPLAERKISNGTSNQPTVQQTLVQLSMSASIELFIGGLSNDPSLTSIRIPDALFRDRSDLLHRRDVCRQLHYFCPVIIAFVRGLFMPDAFDGPLRGQRGRFRRSIERSAKEYGPSFECFNHPITHPFNPFSSPRSLD